MRRKAPSGRLLASGGEDGTIRLCDVSSGACLRILRTDRRYERADIAGLTGVTAAQRAALVALGAVDHQDPVGETTAGLLLPLASSASAPHVMPTSYVNHDAFDGCICLTQSEFAEMFAAGLRLLNANVTNTPVWLPLNDGQKIPPPTTSR